MWDVRVLTKNIGMNSFQWFSRKYCIHSLIQGDVGGDGPQGIAGPTGAQGSRGDSGPQGSQGPGGPNVSFFSLQYLTLW